MRGMNSNYFLKMSFLESYKIILIKLVSSSNYKFTEACVGLTYT